MTRFAYVSGKFVPFGRAVTPIEDRGYQFGDGVYEVISVLHKKTMDGEEHLARLVRSLDGIGMRSLLPLGKMHAIIDEIIHLNRYKHGLVYIQVTRGVAPRAFPFPMSDIPPRLTITMRPMDHKKYIQEKSQGIATITMEDPRWSRVDIKSINLLPSVLSKQTAQDQGAFEAIFTKHGVVTEGASSNIFAVIDGVIRTHPPAHCILDGITKNRILNLCNSLGLPFEEKPFTLEELYGAEEAFITAASNVAIPIRKINTHTMPGPIPGKISSLLQKAYFDFMESSSS